MAEVRRGALKNLTLSQLGAWIGGKEALYGPLVKIEVAADGTVGTFEDSEDPPAAAPSVALDPMGTAACSVGKTKVCTGEAYVSNVRQKVLVCR
ncbi:MAG TPA: hypothetical protein VF552_09165 [Allosphingosinicella sp.]|jgi:hypothetical protein